MSVRFAGYAAVFDVPDRGGDVVRRQAFARVGAVPLLWQHGGKPVGKVERLAADSRGLRVVGIVDHPRLAAAVATGVVTGLSFGYRVTEAHGGPHREIKGLQLLEISLVTSPMQPLARVHAVVRDGGEATALRRSSAGTASGPW